MEYNTESKGSTLHKVC